MQTKSSHRALKWTLFLGLAASLASACVVSTGDGDDLDVDINGGESGSSNTSGTKNTGGTKAGSSSGGASAGMSTTAGMTNGGEDGGGGEGNPDYPGVCDSSLKTPSVLNEAACDSTGDMNACRACLKENCCEAFKACYGKEPTSACGYGTSPATAETDQGQFDCIVNCYERDNDGIAEEADILEGCQSECLNQCADTDDFINEDTNDLMICALNGEDGQMTGDDDCHDVCFPPPM